MEVWIELFKLLACVIGGGGVVQLVNYWRRHNRQDVNAQAEIDHRERERVAAQQEYIDNQVRGLLEAERAENASLHAALREQQEYNLRQQRSLIKLERSHAAMKAEYTAVVAENVKLRAGRTGRVDMSCQTPESKKNESSAS